MNLGTRTTIVLELSTEDFTIVSKALTGTLKPGEKKHALRLASEMVAKRASDAHTQAEVAGGAVQKVAEIVAQSNAQGDAA